MRRLIEYIWIEQLCSQISVTLDQVDVEMKYMIEYSLLVYYSFVLMDGVKLR